ncbi:F0F1 ATP synthase subunit gamma [Acidimangrovimonas pyrenivorans]|uniref:F0F1 ATP synthase subunit gamma n=1 Tax=Acidimangrovimonas pyrenivorans TaxID=2030798 RepID=A0ABV7AGL8_9RHOB
MASLEDLARRIEVAEDLQSVVRTMKTISTVSIRRHEVAEQEMRRYLAVVERGLQVALRHVPRSAAGAGAPAAGPVEGKTGVVVIGSEIGLCGGFNERVVSFALDRLKAAGVGVGERLVLVVGSRAELGWRAEAGPPRHGEEAPTTIEALPAVVHNVLMRLDDWREAEAASRLVLFHQRIAPAGGCAPVEVPLFPIDPGWLAELRGRPWPSRRLPACFGPPAAVTRDLVRQLLYARVFTAVLQSRAAEHAERAAAMQAADRSIGEKLDDLRATHQRLRQETITSELLDIIAGYEASATEAEGPRG